MPSIPAEAFDEIIKELERKPLTENKYRNTSGVGRSQAFGVVNKRCLPPDYSRQNWLRPYLYKALIDFGNKYVDIAWTSITLNQNYRAEKHRDKGNLGTSYLVAFGDYTGGELKIYEGDLSGSHNIRHTPIKAEFNQIYHSVEPFEGNRYSLVYYVLKTKVPLNLPEPSVVEEEGQWVFKRGGEVCKGLPHPLKRSKKSKPEVMKIEDKEMMILFP